MDWQHDGARLKSYVLGRYPPSKFRLIVKNEDLIGSPGLVWTTHATGTFAVRQLRPNCVVSSKGPGIFCQATVSEAAVLGILNSYLASYLMRMISPGSEFGYRYVAQVPIPELSGPSISEIERVSSRCLNLKSALVQYQLPEESFSPLVTS